MTLLEAFYEMQYSKKVKRSDWDKDFFIELVEIGDMGWIFRTSTNEQYSFVKDDFLKEWELV